jgi:hypothetical protein
MIYDKGCELRNTEALESIASSLKSIATDLALLKDNVGDVHIVLCGIQAQTVEFAKLFDLIVEPISFRLQDIHTVLKKEFD